MTSERTTPYTIRLRKRPNHELEYLRQQVVDLEEELAVLRQPVPESLTTTETLELKGDETWEVLATRQSSLANAALMENLKLRSMLEGQLQVARALETTILKKVCQERSWFSCDVGRPRATSLSDELLFAILDEGLEHQYARTDSVLESSGVKHVTYENDTTLQAEDDPQGVSFHGGEERLLPFSVSSVVGAIRGFHSHGVAVQRCNKLRRGDEYLHAATIDKLELPRDQRVQVKARLVQREFPEATRTVIVWAAYVEIEGSMFVRLEEKGWVVVEPHRFKRHGRTLSIPGCRLKSVVRVAPILQFASEEEEKQHIGEMSDLIIGTYRPNFGLLYQALENRILDTSKDEEVAVI